MTDEEEVDAWIKFMDKSVTKKPAKTDDPWWTFDRGYVIKDDDEKERYMTMPTVEKVTFGSLPVILIAVLFVFMALKSRG